MRICLYPLKPGLGPAGFFKVEVEGKNIGYAEVRIHFTAGRDGVLETIRAERYGSGNIMEESKEGVEGKGPLLVIRRYHFDKWASVQDGLSFSCRRV